MPDDQDPKWSDEEERLLRHEAFMAKLLEMRQGRAREGAAPPVWQRFLESSGGAALVTVLFGTLAAGIINSLVQQKLKDRELALAAYQEELKQGQDIAARVVELVGTSMGAAENLVFLTTDEFDPERFSGEQRTKTIEQRTEIREKYNQTDSAWTVESEKLALLVGMHTHGQPQIVEAWRSAQKSVTDYKNCAEDWYGRHLPEPVTAEVARSACGTQKAAVRASLEQFSRLMEDAWHSPSTHSGGFGPTAGR